VELKKIEQDLFPATSLFTFFSSLDGLLGEERKRHEREIVLEMMREIGANQAIEIFHEPSGKPYITPNLGNVSIAHSNGYFAIAFSKLHSVGVDIQTHSSPLHRAKDYFMNRAEQDLFFECDETALFSIWCAKEAVYKLFNGHIADLREEVSVRSIANETILTVFDEEEIQLFCIQNKTLTIALVSS
jgi:phosphopantetheinyl transferase